MYVECMLNVYLYISFKKNKKNNELNILINYI